MYFQMDYFWQMGSFFFRSRWWKLIRWTNTKCQALQDSRDNNLVHSSWWERRTFHLATLSLEERKIFQISLEMLSCFRRKSVFPSESGREKVVNNKAKLVVHRTRMLGSLWLQNYNRSNYYRSLSLYYVHIADVIILHRLDSRELLKEDGKT